LLIARIFPRPCGARKNTTQLVNIRTYYMLNPRIGCIYTTICKYGKGTGQLIFKMELRETMTAGENRFAPKLNEKDVIELLED